MVRLVLDSPPLIPVSESWVSKPADHPKIFIINEEKCATPKEESCTYTKQPRETSSGLDVQS